MRFIPASGKKVNWYTCGPTVYDACTAPSCDAVPAVPLELAVSLAARGVRGAHGARASSRALRVTALF